MINLTLRRCLSSLSRHRRPSVTTSHKPSSSLLIPKQQQKTHGIIHGHPNDAQISSLLSSSSLQNWCRPLASAVHHTSIHASEQNHLHSHHHHPYSGSDPTKDVLHLRCSVLNRDGHLEQTGKDLSKLDLCQTHDLQPRDLRKLDDRFQHQLPAILVRPSAILVNLGLIKAIVRRDSLILVEPTDRLSNNRLSILMFELQNTLKQRGRRHHGVRELPFELQALETLLSFTLQHLRDDVDEHLPPIEHFLHAQTTMPNVDQSTLSSLLHFSKTLSRLQSKVTGVRGALIEVLNSDEDLSAMYLTSNHSIGHRRSPSDHDEAEMLLENYLRESDELLNRLSRVEDNLESTEDIMNIALDSRRNAILFMEVRLAMGTFAVANGAFLCSLFGMNLQSGWETDPHAFWLTSAMSMGVAAMIFSILKRRLR